MNLLTMTEQEKLEAIRKDKLRIANERMGNNAPLDVDDSEKTYLDFIVEGYKLGKPESEGR